MAFKIKHDKGSSFPFKDEFRNLQLNVSNKPTLTHRFNISGQPSTTSGINVPKNVVTNVSGHVGFGNRKRNISLSGGLHLPTKKGNLNLRGKTNIGDKGASIGFDIDPIGFSRGNISAVIPFDLSKKRKRN